ncbi:radial spoke head 1 homolog [Athalia rosae]|uniref:radial spoke head 1 homolog n=1 Tax=Athalia rosae TaxID=37344 RepID=UPI0020349969|nr:radial spoke head 1 homolog [Athalia rosae]
MPTRVVPDGEGGEGDRNPLGRYEGERNERGERHGQGKALLPNGDMYVGSYCKGLRHGKGIYVFRNGARYDGDWRCGLKYGVGTFWYPDGTRYEGDWKRDTKYGFGVYHYVNNDVYEGSWKKNLRHGMGTYLYSATGTQFMGTWIKGRMQGPGKLIHPRHHFHGFWELNQPFGRGCFTFENHCMQHGHYIHIRDPNYDETQEESESLAAVGVSPEKATQSANETAEGIEPGKDSLLTNPSVTEKPLPLKKGIIALWRARYITAYNPDLLPPEPEPLQEEASQQSLDDKCEEDGHWPESEQYLTHEECEGEYHREQSQEEEYFEDHIDSLSGDSASREETI